MDNEASTLLKRLFKKIRTVVQLAPSHSHRINSVERNIQTFNDPFLMGLASVGKISNLFTIPDSETSRNHYNLSKTSIKNPRLSEHGEIFGTFDFNATLRAPLGTKSITHEKPSQLATFSRHGVADWYIGPSLEHYRCYI